MTIICLKGIQYNPKTLEIFLVARLQVHGGGIPIRRLSCSPQFPGKFRISSFTSPSSRRRAAGDHYCKLTVLIFLVDIKLLFPGKAGFPS